MAAVLAGAGSAYVPTAAAAVDRGAPNWHGVDRLGRPVAGKGGVEVGMEFDRALLARADRVGAQQSSQAALNQRAAIAGAGAGVPGVNGTWAKAGKDSLLDNVSDYSAIDSIPTMSGRIQGVSYDPANLNRVFVAVGGGGIWESRDLGSTWREISDGVPTQTAGDVAYLPLGTGVILDGTGDSGYGWTGNGIWRSVDDGATWQRGAGSPDGALTWRLAIDPGNPRTVYAATTKGLYRSQDAGLSWVNLKIPTGSTYSGGPDCAGNTTEPTCYFNNWFTAVVVRPSDATGTGGGKVLTVAGWYRGTHMTVSTPAWNQAPGNGLYESDSGDPGTFTKINPMGFTQQTHIGTTSLSVATGATQNHDVVWAMVEDAQKLDGNAPIIDPQPGVPSDLGLLYNSVLDGIYMSTDFGKSWTKKVDANQLSSCTTGTDLCGFTGLPLPVVGGSYGPGVQAWYNNWIQIDPTLVNSGLPTRVTFGLEEVWEINQADMAGPSNPKVIGRYFGQPYCATQTTPLVLPNLPGPCPLSQATPTTTHPDQHGSAMVPDGSGGVTLFAGGDGGLFIQHVGSGGDFDNQHWGNGANQNLHTLLSYDAAVSGDGTIYTGLQDNGEDKIEPGGRQIEVFGGDGGFSAVDPHDSTIAYEEYVGGSISATTDGGHTWASINPGDTSPQFIVPFTMDPNDSKHVLTGGEDIEETTAGAATTTPTTQSTPAGTVGPPGGYAATDWYPVYDLGVSDKSSPGAGQPNVLSASSLVDENAYVGYCGACYIASTEAFGVYNGIATNVGGSAAPQVRTANGWHKASVNGLPRYQLITSVQQDPANARTIYVTLGDDANVTYRPQGSLGEDTSRASAHHVFVSHDAGENFTDISGNLPDVFTNWITTRGSQLLVATNIGVFISSDLKGTQWGLLGGLDGLPIVPVTTLHLQPGHADRLIAATYGRGVMVYNFPAVATAAASPTPVAAATVTPTPAPTPAKAPLPNTAAGVALRMLPPLLVAVLLGALLASPRRRRLPRR